MEERCQTCGKKSAGMMQRLKECMKRAKGGEKLTIEIGRAHV